MGRGVKIGVSIYHSYRGQYTMGTGVDIPWVGWGRYAMDRVSKYHGYGCQYTMGRGLIYHG